MRRPSLALLAIALSLPAVAGCWDRGGGTPVVPPTPPKPGAVDPLRNAFVPTTDPYGEPATRVAYLPQNWSAEESLRFYFTPQGSQLIPYDWFLALEQPGESTTPFRDPQNILRYRYLPQQPDAFNPDGLPVGFVGEVADGVKWLGMSCAACHTGELHVDGVAYRVDGSPTQANVQALLADLIVAVRDTAADAARFDRFAAKVLGSGDSAAARSGLKAQMAKWEAIRSGYNRRNFPGYDPAASTPQGPLAFGHFGQLDAVGAILNEVYWNAATVQDLANPTAVAAKADAPVSYPFLWNAHQQDKVQWLGIAESGGPGNLLSLVRNVGEVVGVFGHVEIPAEAPTLNPGYRSTIDRHSLEALEDLITTLWSPRWPEAFGAIDPALAAQGAEVFKRPLEQNQSCYACHGEIVREDPARHFDMNLFGTQTDPKAYFNFLERSGPSGRLEGRPINFVPLTETIPATASATQMITHEITGVILGTYTLNPPVDQLKDVLYGRRVTRTLGAPRNPSQYEARPLNGIWATAPYLHNGSVPTLDALLRPAAERPTSFRIGVRAFDTQKVGLGAGPATSTLPMLDTTAPGHTNGGHEYGVSLSEPDRRALIEYLKSL